MTLEIPKPIGATQATTIREVSGSNKSLTQVEISQALKQAQEILNAQAKKTTSK